MKKNLLLSYLCLCLLIGCIGDDILFDTVEPTIRITNALDTLALGESYQFNSAYRNNIGAEEVVEVIWKSANSEIISITSQGVATALQLGSTDLTASFSSGATLTTETITVHVGDNTIATPTERFGAIQTTSSYELTGDFTLTANEESGLTLSFANNYVASTALPGLYVYLTNNPNTNIGALEIGAVSVFNGAHSYNIPNTSLQDYSHVLYFCKPFNVKVGDGLIK